MITPAIINAQQFTSTRLKGGYDPTEVDVFLDKVEVALASALAERDSALKEVERLKRLLEQATSEAPTTVMNLTPAGSAEKILVAAQRTAEQVEAEANAEAGQIRAAARAEADNVRMNAESERQRILNQLETERGELAEKIEVLKSKRAGYKSWLKAALTKIEEEEATGA